MLPSLGIEVFFPLVFLGLAAPFVRGRRQWVTAGIAVAAQWSAVVLCFPRSGGSPPPRSWPPSIGSRIK